jgi:hypothetical protein
VENSQIFKIIIIIIVVLTMKSQFIDLKHAKNILKTREIPNRKERKKKDLYLNLLIKETHSA